MAKAGGKITWRSMSAERDFVAETSTWLKPYAQEWLAKQAAAGRIRWSFKAFHDHIRQKPGQSRNDAIAEMCAGLWNDPWRREDWEQGAVFIPVASGPRGPRGLWLCGIHFVHEDVEAALALCRASPSQPPTPEPKKTEPKAASTVVVPVSGKDKARGKTEEWVYRQMQAQSSRVWDPDFINDLHGRCPFEVSHKRIANLVGEYRKEFPVPAHRKDVLPPAGKTPAKRR